MTETFTAKWAPRLLSVVRIVFAFTFVVHGTQKLFGYPGNGQPFVHDWFTLFGWAGMIETVGGTLLLLGLFTRPVAFLASGEMAVAYFTQHAPHGFWPLLNRGELPVHYSFFWLYIALMGGGAWSLDALIRRRREQPPAA